MTHPHALLGAGVGLVFMLGAATACSRTPADPQVDRDAATGEAPVGSVYADLQVEYLAAGERLYRSMYDEVGPACRELGMGTQLPEDYVAKLGTSRLQVWSAHDRVAVRNEVYAYTSGPVEEGRHCDFEPVTKGLHVYRDGKETVTWDLATGVESRGPAQPEYEWKRSALAAGPLATDADGRQRRANGVPCYEYEQSPGGATYCIWSGGGAYGFDSEGRWVSNAMGGESGMLTGLVVDQTPTRDGSGQRVTLSALLLDDKAPFASMRPHAPTIGPHAGRGSDGASR